MAVYAYALNAPIRISAELRESGSPVTGATVTAEVVAATKGPKIIIFKYRPKKRIRVKTGHRQQYTRLKVNSIEVE